MTNEGQLNIEHDIRPRPVRGDGDDQTRSKHRGRLQAVRPVSPPVPSPWKREAEAMQAAGVGLRDQALTLPEPSDVRQQMLDCADAWLLQAALRGLPLPAPHDSAARQAG